MSKKSMKFLSTGLAALCAIGAVTFAQPAAAEFPEKPIRFVLHAKPGGGTDTMARKVAAGIEKLRGWDVVVENHAGGKTAKQMALLTRSKPDGYTIGSVTASGIGVWNSALKDKYSVDSVDWVVRIVQEPYIIAVKADSPYKTLTDLLDHMKANPGKTSLAASIGRGSAGHIMWEMLAEAGGVPSKNVNYVSFDSMSEAVTQLVGGHITAAINFVDLLKGQVDAGNLRVLAVLSGERSAVLSDVPTAKEAGVDVFPGWQQFRGITAPRGTPKDVKEKIAAAVKEVVESPSFQDYVTKGSLQTGYMGPDEFAAFAKEQDKVTKDWLKRLAIN